MKLDLKDYKILLELDRNCRQSLNNIAKKVRLSKDSVAYRIHRLETQKYILRYQCHINHGKLGYANSRINLKLQNTTPEIEAEIIEFVKNYPDVAFFASVEGNIDYIIFLFWKSPIVINNFWNLITEKYKNYIQSSEVGIYSKIVHYPRTYLTNEKNVDQIIFTAIDEEENVDSIDLNIIKILSKDARSSLVTIAKILKLSTKTVSARIRHLESREIITGYSVSLDIDKLGYLYYKIYFDLQNTNKEILQKLDVFILSNPNIIYRDYVIGGHSCEIEVQVKNETELRDLISKIKEKFSSIIRDYEILHYYKEHKLLSLPWSG